MRTGNRLTIHRTEKLVPNELPEGAKLIGYKSFTQQELKLEIVNIRYRRAQYRLPDGSIVSTPRPAHLLGQYGLNLRCYILHQYYQSQVTEPLIRQRQLELGVKISSGQISRTLTEGHERCGFFEQLA